MARDRAYRPSRRVPRIPNGAPRHVGRHTRSNPAGPLYAGLVHERASRIRDDPANLVTIRAFRPTIATLPLLPPPLAPRLLPAQRLPPPAFTRAYPQIPPANLQVFATSELRTKIFSHLNRGSQDTTRLLCAQFAAVIPPFYQLSGAHVQAQMPNIRCRNRRFRKRVRAPPMPNTPGNPPFTYLFSTVGRRPCRYAFSTHPGLQYRVCDGTQVLHGGNSPHHAADFTICSDCADRAWLLLNFDLWYGERSLPLCFKCSTDKINSDWWARCDCMNEQQPFPHGQTNPETRYYFCADCRLDWAMRITDGIIGKVQNEYRMMVRPNADPLSTCPKKIELLRQFVHDTDAQFRSRCKCGLSYTEIMKSYPQIWPDANWDIANTDFNWLFRECLVCGFHVQNHRPWTQPSACY